MTDTPDTAQVTSLQRARPNTDAGMTSCLSQVEAYWNALCHAGVPPKRSQIDPRGIETALEYAFIAERIAQGEARLRVAGLHLSDLMGMEMRGMPLSSLFLPASRSGLSNSIAAVFDSPAILRLRLSGETGLGKPTLRAHALLLPLRGDDGAVNRALGCLVSDGAIGRCPRRFTIDATDIRPALAQPADLASQPARGLAEPVVPFRRAPHDKAHLRLVTSD